MDNHGNSESYLMGEAPAVPPANTGDPELRVYGGPQAWVMPMAFWILNGYGPRDAFNGISVDEQGDMVIYRRLCHEDWKRHVQLIGVEEVWISIRISDSQ